MAKKRRTSTAKRASRASLKSRPAGRSRKAEPRRGALLKRALHKKASRKKASRPKKSGKPQDLQEHVLQVFAEQFDSLWSSFADQCGQFAAGFNQAMGSSALEIHVEPLGLRASYPQAEVELVMRLDQEEGLLLTSINTVSSVDGRVFTDNISIGLTVSSDTLKFVMEGDVVTAEHVAVTLLTRLTAGDDEAQQA